MQKFRLPWAVPFCYHSFDSPSYFPQDWRLVKIETFSKGTVWFCLSEISLSIGSLCFNQLNQANMWLVRLPSIYACSQIISVPLRASESAVHKALIMGGTLFTTNWDLWNSLMERSSLGVQGSALAAEALNAKTIERIVLQNLNNPQKENLGEVNDNEVNVWCLSQWDNSTWRLLMSFYSVLQKLPLTYRCAFLICMLQCRNNLNMPILHTKSIHQR